MSNESSPLPHPRIFIVDDHPIVRQGLIQLINCEPGLVVVGGAEDSQEAMRGIEKLNPDLVVIDITLKGTSGLELIKNIKALRPDLPTLVLSMHDEALYAERAMRAGARGYVMKQAATEDLAKAIRRVLNGNMYVSEEMTIRMMQRALAGRSSAGTSPVDALSDREVEVLKLIGRGHGTRQIAKELSLSIKTVESHRAHIKEKLNLVTAPEMVRFAVNWISQKPA